MNNYEATRFVHKLIADTLANEFAHVSASDYPWSAGKDAPKLRRVLDHWIELHRRRGPLAADRAPREAEYRGEKLPLEDADAEPQTQREVARDGSAGTTPALDVAHDVSEHDGRESGGAANAGVAGGGESGEGTLRVEDLHATTDVGQNAAAPTADTASAAGYDPAVPAVQAPRELSDDHDRRASGGAPVPLVPPRMEHRNAAGQVIARPNITDAGQHYMHAPRGDREPMRLTLDPDYGYRWPDTAAAVVENHAEMIDAAQAAMPVPDDIDEALQPLNPETCKALRVSAYGVFACTLPRFHADSMNATPHDWQELDTCSARRMRTGLDEGTWRCIKSNGHIDEHDWRKEQP